MINLKKLSNKDITEKYLKWMNDKKVHQYTEQRHSKHSIKKIKKFVSEKNKSKNEFLFGIYLKNQHIGNIKLGPINNIHKYAFISYFIGLIVDIDNSLSCFASTSDGASVIKHDDDCVLGKAIVSLIDSRFKSSITILSMPNAMPPCGGQP